MSSLSWKSMRWISISNNIKIEHQININMCLWMSQDDLGPPPLPPYFAIVPCPQYSALQVRVDSVVHLFRFWPFFKLPTSKVHKAGAKEPGSVRAAAAQPIWRKPLTMYIYDLSICPQARWQPSRWAWFPWGPKSKGGAHRRHVSDSRRARRCQSAPQPGQWAGASNERLDNCWQSHSSGEGRSMYRHWIDGAMKKRYC